MDTRSIIAHWLFKEQWDFTQIPSMAEFSAYSSATLAASSGDGKIHPDERAWVIGYFSTIGLPEDQVPVFERAEPQQLTTELRQRLDAFRKTPAGQASCRGLIYDCIRAAAADQEYHPSEAKAIHGIGEMLGIDGATVSKIEDVFKKDQERKSKRLKLFFPEGSPFAKPAPGAKRPTASRDIIAHWYFREDWDFQQVPSMSEFGAYADAVIAAAAGDGTFAQAERDWVVGYFATIGMPDAQLAAFQSVDPSKAAAELPARLAAFRKTPAGQVSCRGLVYDCIRAAGADKAYHDKESTRVHQLGEAVGVSREVTKQIEEVYAAEQAAKKERLALLFPQGIAFMK
jgi:hypothetical protein